MHSPASSLGRGGTHSCVPRRNVKVFLRRPFALRGGGGASLAVPRLSLFLLPAGALAAWPRSSSPSLPGRGACRALAFPGSRWRIGAAGAPLQFFRIWQRPYTAPSEIAIFFPPCRNREVPSIVLSIHPIFTEVPINFKKISTDSGDLCCGSDHSTAVLRSRCRYDGGSSKHRRQSSSIRAMP